MRPGAGCVQVPSSPYRRRRPWRGLFSRLLLSWPPALSTHRSSGPCDTGCTQASARRISPAASHQRRCANACTWTDPEEAVVGWKRGPSAWTQSLTFLYLHVRHPVRVRRMAVRVSRDGPLRLRRSAEGRGAESGAESAGGAWPRRAWGVLDTISRVRSGEKSKLAKEEADVSGPGPDTWRETWDAGRTGISGEFSTPYSAPAILAIIIRTCLVRLYPHTVPRLGGGSGPK